MADSLTIQRRSWNMSRIRGKDTGIELKVRKYLHSHGFRYRIHVRELPGTPDIVFRRYKTVIFIHGCFWHRHAGCKDATVPKTRTEFWEEKFRRNMLNDESHYKHLKEMGWKILILWECKIDKQFDETMQALLKELSANYSIVGK